MGKYSVICLSLKSARQPGFQNAFINIRRELAEEFERHMEISDSGKLLETEKVKFLRILSEQAEYDDLSDALKFLSKCLFKAYGEKAILLIDEYDVPLENAYIRGFYEEMTDFIRSLFETALKTNPYLEFAVITGCLRILKESIFTGMNNLDIVSILDNSYAEYFGFDEDEVKEIWMEYGLTDS